MASLLEHLEAAGESCTPGLRSAFLALEKRVAELEALVHAQAGEIRELKRRLKRSSMNSSLPSSSDPPHLKRQRQKKKTGRRRGAQPGHEPHQRSLLPPERVDRFVDHYPTLSRHCGHRFGRRQEVGTPERRQEIERPEIRALLIEHHLHRLRCPCCGGTTPAIAPASVRGVISVGARLSALCAMLTVRLRASRRNLQRVLGDLLDVPAPSVGLLQQLLEEVSAACTPAYQQVRQSMRSSSAVGVDETTWSLRGRTYWLWTAVTRTLSCFRIANRRSGWARQRLLGVRYGGIMTSDRLALYHGVPPPQRQLCWAHLKRDFADWQSYGGRAEKVARALERCTRDLFVLWHGYCAGEYDRAELQSRLQPLQEQVRTLLGRATCCGTRRVQKSCKQLLELWPALWNFSVHPGVEPTNNEAERALRAGVIWRKTSFGSQSGKGLRLVERLLTVAETCKKQNQDLLDYLTNAVTASRTGRLPPPLLATS